MPGNEMLLAALGGTGGFAILFSLIRMVWRRASTELVDTKSDLAKGDIITTLREEVSRLEVVTKNMQARIETLEDKVGKLNNRLVTVRGHALSAYAVVTMLCDGCAGDQKKKIIDALTAIIKED